MSDFTITDRAAEHILSEAKEKGKSPVLRVGIKGGGCTGYTYVFEWLSGSASEKDLVFENNGAKVVIDPKSMIYLSGSELGYQQRNRQA